MKPAHPSITSGILLLLTATLFSQVHLTGSLQSSVYTFETPAVQQGNFYQGVNLRLNHERLANSYITSYLRVFKLGDADWEERVYNLYGNWQSANRNYQVRAGRQFLYQGVINGTLDGLLVSARPVPELTVKAFAGLEAPFDRDLRAVGSDSNAFGGYLSYRTPWEANVDISYFQRQRDDELIWQVVGAALNGKYGQNFYYQAQVDHNLKSEELQGLRFRLNYYYSRWSLSGEYNNQRPRILEDSYFRIFSIDAFQQFRGGVGYQINQYQVGAQYLFTDYEFDQANQVILTAANTWGLIGLVFQNGYGGDNVGAYGDVRYNIIPQLTVKLYSAYQNYELQTTNISEDATSFSGGLEYRPVDYLALQAELQESINRRYDNDLRGLFRIRYSFRR